MNTYIVGAKGGVGTSSVAAASALLIGRTHRVNLVADDLADLRTILGLAEGTTSTGAVFLTRSPVPGERNVIDAGTTWPDQDGEVLLVLRNDYLSLRRALGMPRPDRVVLIVEPDRSITVADVTDVLGVKPFVIVAKHVTARAIDAGLLACRPSLPFDVPVIV